MRSLPVALLLLPALPAFAASCEDSFAKKGNTFTGTTFSGAVTVPNLSVESALGQMRAIVTAKGMAVLKPARSAPNSFDLIGHRQLHCLARSGQRFMS